MYIIQSYQGFIASNSAQSVGPICAGKLRRALSFIASNSAQSVGRSYQTRQVWQIPFHRL